MTQEIKYSGREEEKLGGLQMTTRSTTGRQNAYDMRVNLEKEDEGNIYKRLESKEAFITDLEFKVAQ